MTCSVGNLTINLDSFSVTCSDYELALRRKEVELLTFFARNPGKIINRLTLLEYVWNYSNQINTNTLEVHINSLRKKIAARNGNPTIETIHGIGYRLRIPATA
jgi:two-component system, OmpR family, response regulator